MTSLSVKESRMSWWQSKNSKEHWALLLTCCVSGFNVWIISSKKQKVYSWSWINQNVEPVAAVVVNLVCCRSRLCFAWCEEMSLSSSRVSIDKSLTGSHQLPFLEVMGRSLVMSWVMIHDSWVTYCVCLKPYSKLVRTKKGTSTWSSTQGSEYEYYY